MTKRLVKTSRPLSGMPLHKADFQRKERHGLTSGDSRRLCSLVLQVLDSRHAGSR